MKTNSPMPCELCRRECDRLTVHHLVPRQQTKRKQMPSGSTIDICSACHRQIHTLFDNRRLADDLNTADKLCHEPNMRRFLLWLQKQDPNKRIKVSHIRN